MRQEIREIGTQPAANRLPKLPTTCVSPLQMCSGVWQATGQLYITAEN